MPKINIDKQDSLRPLLTDTLPFETPICFSNEGFYNALKKPKGTIPPILKEIQNELSKLDTTTVPFTFRIKRTGLKVRALSIPHPYKQLEICKFYLEFADYITYLCGLSNFSIRKPSSVASVYYKRAPISIDFEDDGTRTASTYFSYQRHRLLYQFYSSRRYVKLEKKYRYLRAFDIANCFGSIYTHSVCWATKGKRAAKASIGMYNFENQFDRIMQKMNNSETAGILIGPEFSRIFAEIILQSIDASVEKSLSKRGKLLSVHYEVCRYVDDYFVFSNDRDLLDQVQNLFQEHLEEYRLHLNDSKIFDDVSPFSTTISIAKEDLAASFDFLSDCIVDIDGKLEFTDQFTKPLAMISKLKASVARNSVNFYSVSGYIFFRLKRIVRKFQRGQLVSSVDVAYHFIENFLDVCFYLYSMDVRVTTTYPMAKLIVDIIDFCERSLAPVQSRNIQKLIFDEIHSILKVEVEQKENSLIEMANLLIILRRINTANKIPVELVNSLWQSLKTGSSQFEYLSAMSLPFTCENNPEFAQVKNDLLDYIQNFVSSSHDKFRDSAFFMTFFDIVKCPFVDDSYKQIFIGNCGWKRNLSTVEVRKIKQFVMENDWFTDWSLDFDLSRKLQKREFVSPYES